MLTFTGYDSFSFSVLLHAYMRDYTTCNAIAHIWLRNPRNESSQHYNNLVEIYLANVVIPQKKWKDVQPFLDSCRGLTFAVKEEFQRYDVTSLMLLMLNFSTFAFGIKVQAQGGESTRHTIPNMNGKKMYTIQNFYSC